MKNLAYSFLAFALLVGCGSDTPPGGDDDNPIITDTDKDGISDADEGEPTSTDTDGDGTPDYLDSDSDDDGIPDSVEAGDQELDTDPFDSDGDGVFDFRDLDADGNGRPDPMDGTGDFDGDGRLDFADTDDDGDMIGDVTELGEAGALIDTDGDSVPDFQDLDSDDDTIQDVFETHNDFDADGVGNWRDLDSDDDCRSDEIESGGVSPPVNTDMDARPDFIDRDIDADGVPDRVEDANCNGVTDPGETDAKDDDTDNDGASDLIETAAGTDPLNPTDNPQANGDFVFLVPYQEAPTPNQDDLDFTTSLKALDMYVILDRSGSMSTAITNVKNNLATVVRNLTCPPAGTGIPGQCIPDLWAGAGTVGYMGVSGNSFINHVDIQPNPSFASVAVTEPGGCCEEPLSFGAYSAITGNGSGATTCSIGTPVPPRTSCANSPAKLAGFNTFGYPCFREGVLPVVLLATDEPPLSASMNCPNWMTSVAPLFNARGGKLVGILGNASGTVETDLEAMAVSTGAVDAANGNAPLVFEGVGTNASAAIENGMRVLARGVPLDLNAIPEDDPADAVDAVQAFVDRLETLQLGTPQCTNGLTDVDTNGDAIPDQYNDVPASTPVCWRLIPKLNTTVPGLEEPQLFKANVTVFGNSITNLDSRQVFFLVPPAPDVLE